MDLGIRGLYHFDAAGPSTRVTVAAHGSPPKWTGKLESDWCFEDSKLQLHLTGAAVLQFRVCGFMPFRGARVLAPCTISTAPFPEYTQKEFRIELAGQKSVSDWAVA